MRRVLTAVRRTHRCVGTRATSAAAASTWHRCNVSPMGCNTHHACNVPQCLATPGTHSLSQVLWNDVMECTDISAGLDVLGKYGLHDLVQLDAAMGGGAQQHMAVGACNVARCIPFPLTLASSHFGARRLAPARTWPVFCQAWSSSLSQTPCPFWTRVIASKSSSCASVALKLSQLESSSSPVEYPIDRAGALSSTPLRRLYARVQARDPFQDSAWRPVPRPAAGATYCACPQ